jgi:hypothetical protein
MPKYRAPSCGSPDEPSLLNVISDCWSDQLILTAAMEFEEVIPVMAAVAGYLA